MGHRRVGRKEAETADPIDELFEVLPQEFTRRRNELSKELKDSGNKEQSERVAALKRPTLAVWAVNQLARRHDETVDELIQVQRALADATAAEDLQQGSSRRRRLVGVLTDKARDLLVEGGLSASTQTVERIRATLLAVNTPDEEELLREGRLERGLEASGFADAFAGLSLEEITEDEVAEPDEGARREAEELASQAHEARAEAKRLAREAARLRADADAAENEARSADRRAVELEERAEAAKKRL